jgi:hypothetical protein
MRSTPKKARLRSSTWASTGPTCAPASGRDERLGDVEPVTSAAYT